MRCLFPCLALACLLAAVGPAPAQPSQEPLPGSDPVAFLEKSLERYEKDGIQGYTCTFIKKERIDGKLQNREVIQASFRERPHSVFFEWKEGQRLASRVLYVEGENNGKMLARPAGAIASRLVPVAERDVDGADARKSGRYTLQQFGMRKATQRTLAAWKAARDRGEDLRIKDEGVQKIREVGDRPCYILRRTCTRPDEGDIMQATFYFDKETWLQVGSVLKDKAGNLLGEYYFRDLRINPKFPPDQFQRAALTR